MKTVTPKVEDRFWSKVDANGPCWEWMGGTDSLGYGTFWLIDRNKKAHRVAYELLVGPIPEGLTLDHLCRNRACVNPDHLEPVTLRENWMRGDTIAKQRARKTHCPKGHPYSGDNLYTRPGGWRGCHTCRTEQRRARREMGRVG